MIVYVKWIDSAIWRDDEWSINELDGPTNNESAGLLVEETDDRITIALDKCLDTDLYRLILCIPKINILEMRRYDS